MRNLCFLLLAAAAAVLLIHAGDWPMQGGNPQHNGWAKSEHLLTRDNVANLKVLYKYHPDNVSKAPNALTAPIINGNLITYRGFKEMLIFAAGSDKVFSVDADLDKILWESKLPYHADKPRNENSTALCPAGLTAPVIMAGSSSAFMPFAVYASRTPAAGSPPPPRPSHYLPSLSQSVYPLRPTTLTQLNALYTVSSDGNLHVLNSSTGEDLIASIRFLPPNSKVTSLNLHENVIYATTAGHCDGYQNALFAMDLLSPEKTVSSFIPPGGEFGGVGGAAIGNDGTLYVQLPYAPPYVSQDKIGDYHDTTVALTPKDLKIKDYFTPAGKSLNKKTAQLSGITPLVFSWMGKEYVLAGGRNRRLYLLDTKSLGGADHHTPVFAADPVAQPGRKGDPGDMQGTFSSWMDIDTETRWFYIPVAGRIAVLKLTSGNGQPQFQPVWTSPDLSSTAPVVIANGIAFVLSTGESPNGPGAAVLYAFDAVTGKQLYSSGNIGSGSAPEGLAVANGRVYFTTTDGDVYCFGLPKGQLQLTEQ